MKQAAICPACGHGFDVELVDGRAAAWRVRVRLFGPDSVDEPVADTDYPAPANEPGAMVIHGLPAVAAEVVSLVQSMHTGAILAGFEPEVIARRVRGVRPTLSKQQGSATWRFPYLVDGVKWIAHVALERVERP